MTSQLSIELQHRRIGSHYFWVKIQNTETCKATCSGKSYISLPTFKDTRQGDFYTIQRHALSKKKDTEKVVTEQRTLCCISTNLPCESVKGIILGVQV